MSRVRLSQSVDIQDQALSHFAGAQSESSLLTTFSVGAGGVTNQAVAASYSEPMANGPGVSIKVSTTPGGPVVQFEYTYSGGKVYYDTSNIDANPFAQQGTSLVPSTPPSTSYPSCVTIDCPPGKSCAAAYNQPNDVATHVCAPEADITFTVCTGAKLGGGSSVGGKASSVAPAASPAAGQKAVQPAAGAPANSAPAAQGKSAAAPASTAPVAQVKTPAAKADASAPASGKPAAAAAAQPTQTRGQYQKHQRRGHPHPNFHAGHNVPRYMSPIG